MTQLTSRDYTGLFWVSKQ